VGVEKSNIIVSQPSVEEGMAETPNTISASPQEFVNAPDAGATMYLVAIFFKLYTTTYGCRRYNMQLI
jgi:hypothetical protein